MTNVIDIRPARRELAARSGTGIHVRLLWTAADDSVSVEVFDERTDELLEARVPRDCALDAFYHPYTYTTAPAFAAAA